MSASSLIKQKALAFVLAEKKVEAEKIEQEQIIAEKALQETRKRELEAYKRAAEERQLALILAERLEAEALVEVTQKAEKEAIDAEIARLKSRTPLEILQDDFVDIKQHNNTLKTELDELKDEFEEIKHRNWNLESELKNVRSELLTLKNIVNKHINKTNDIQITVIGWKYLRLRILETRDKNSTHIQMSKLKFKNKDDVEIEDTPIRLYTENITASRGEDANNLFKTNGNKWCVFQNKPCELIMEYFNPINPSAWGYETGNDEDFRDPTAWTLEGSNNYTNWTLLHSQLGKSGKWIDIGYEWDWITLPSGSTIRYGLDTTWIEKVIQNNSSIQVSNHFFGGDPSFGNRKIVQRWESNTQNEYSPPKERNTFTGYFNFVK